MRKMGLFGILCGILLFAVPNTMANAMVVSQENEEAMKDMDTVINSEVVMVEKEDGKTIKVTLQEDAQNDMTYAELYAITSEIEEDCEITIQEMVDCSDGIGMIETEAGDYVVRTSTWTGECVGPMSRAWYDTVYKVTNFFFPRGEIEHADNFIISVARGQSISLSSTYSCTLTSRISASCSIPDAGAITAELGGNLSHVITKEEKFCGPSEDSAYNSREYRCKYYMNKGIFHSYWEGLQSGEGTEYCGEYYEPSRYALYSIDSLIQ